MYAIVYLNAGTPVFTSPKIYSSLKHRFNWLIRLILSLKNNTLRRRDANRLCYFQHRIRLAMPSQKPVFKRLMRDVL